LKTGNTLAIKTERNNYLQNTIGGATRTPLKHKIRGVKLGVQKGNPFSSQQVIDEEKDRIVITTNGTYPWSFFYIA